MTWILLLPFIFLGAAMGHAQSWNDNYRMAMAKWPTDPAVSCTLFSDLSKITKSPLTPLAATRFAHYCMTNQLADAIQKLRTLHSQHAWLSPLTLEALIELAKKNRDKQTLVEFASAQVKMLSSQKEKERI